MGTRLKALAGNLVVLTLSLALTASAVEIGLRLFGAPPPSREDSLSAFTEYDPMLGWRGRPGARGHFRFQGTLIEVEHNRGGWRDDEPEPAPQSGAVAVAPEPALHRVALLGDSFAWGFGVDRQERFDDQLERLLPGWRVQNYGVSGYGTDQELLLLRHVATDARPEVVLVAFAVGNDLWNILASEAYHLPKPRFRLDPDGLRLENVPVPRIGDWDRRSNTGLRDVLTEHLRLYSWVRVRWAAIKPGVRRLIGRPIRSIPADERLQILARGESTDRMTEGWELAERLLAAIHEEAATAGARMMLLIVPDPLQVDDALWTSVVGEFQLDSAAYDRDRPSTLLQRLGRDHGFAVVDPLPAMRRHAREGVPVFLPGDPHWNAEGHRIAAEELAAALAP